MAIVTNTFLKANVPYRVGPGANDLRTFSTNELAAYVHNTRAMMREGGLSVPVLSEHAPPGSEEGGPVQTQFADALKTAGWLKDVRFNPETGEAKAFYEITSKPYLAAIQEGSIRFTSPELRESYVDGLGRQWGQTFAHFALTPKPRNPAQTQLSSADGVPQFAMQFSMADAVGIRPEEMPVLQFVNFKAQTKTAFSPEEADAARRFLGGRPSMRRQNMEALDSHANDNMMEEKGGPVRQRMPKGGLRIKPNPTRPLDRPVYDSDGEPADPKPMNRNRGGGGAYNSGVTRPNKQYTGMRRKKVGNMPGPGYERHLADSKREDLHALQQKYKAKHSKPTFKFDEDAEQFDYALQDAGMGFPGPVPQQDTMQGPFGPGNGLETALLGQAYPQPSNPDVIKAPDEAKRQKSEAVTQLMGQLGLQMPADTDWTALDDGVLNALLASLKTLIDAESRYEQDNAQQAQDMQLKEQVPMAGQMSEDAVQFGKSMRRARSEKFKNERKGIPNTRRPSHSPGPRPSGSRKKSKTEAYSMSEDTDRLNRRLAATKARLDGNARHGLGQYVANAPLPAGIKKYLMAKVGGVQFSADGGPQPTFTVQEVVKILSTAVPPQFSEEELLEAAPANHRDQRQTREQLSRRMGDRAASDDGLQMSESDIDAYYDKKFRDPTWAKLGVNGHSNGSNGSH